MSKKRKIQEESLVKDVRDPTMIVGTFTLDQALDAGILKGAVSYHPSGRSGCWVLRYEDGQVGRAVVVCYGFELLTIGLAHRRRERAVRSAKGDTARWSPPLTTQRPARWRDAS